MKRISLIFLIFLSIKTYSQIDNGYYIGYERMCWKNSKGKKECYDAPRKWYHKNNLLINNDSIFIYKEPIHINKKDTLYSASDGAFFYFAGKILKNNDQYFATLLMTNCDYCARKVVIDSITGYVTPVTDTFTYQLANVKTDLVINNVAYKLQKNDSFPIPRQFFHQFFTIKDLSYRRNPLQQYDLINQCLKDFLNQDTLDFCDTNIVCLDRYEFDDKIETFDKNLLNKTFNKYIVDYLSLKDIFSKSEILSKPVRFIQIGEIYDTKVSTRISLNYKNYIPSKVINFQDKDYRYEYYYDKKVNEYKFREGVQTGWSLIKK
jgi:hypothetical protein